MNLPVIILDRSHRTFVCRAHEGDLWRLPEVPVPAPGTTLLEHLESSVRDRWKIDLPTPAGLHQDTFVFILEDELPLTNASQTWLRLLDLSHHLPVAIYEGIFWPAYRTTMLGGFEPPRRGLDVIYFGNTPIMAAKLAHLVAIGKKTATSGLLESMKVSGSLLPYPGLITLVTDFFGYPHCLIQTLEVRISPFSQVSADVATAEGEGDLSLGDWRRGHAKFFESEAKQLGFEFTPAAQVFSEFFRLIKKLGKTE